MREKPKAYLEASVWNRIVDRQDPARRRQTRAFLRVAGGRLRLFASATVRGELTDAPDEDVRTRLIRRLEKYRPRPVTMSRRVERILEELMDRGIGTATRVADMTHLALAISAGMDYLVSWDERHLANPRIERLVREYCRANRYNDLRIGTPEQVTEWVGRTPN